MKWKWFFIVPAAIAGMFLFAFLGGQLVKLLWNWLIPPLFDGPALTFWQALGLLVLCRILVGGFGHGGSGSGRAGRRRTADRIADRVADRVAERLELLTPEERDRLRQRIHDRYAPGNKP